MNAIHVKFPSMILLLWFWPLLTAAATATLAERVDDPLCGRIEQFSQSGPWVIQGAVVTSGPLLPELYRRNGLLPLWRQPLKIGEMMQLIARSWDEGLIPEDYHQTILMHLLRRHRTEPMTHCERVDLDLLLSDALLRLGFHLRYGKVNPKSLDPNWNLQHLVEEDPLRSMQHAIEADSLNDYLRQFIPTQLIYERLKQALAQYRAIAAHGGWPEIPGGESIEPGDHDFRLALIRGRLQLSGDLEEAPVADPHQYDRQLVEAVRRFQRRHSLEADGVVGRKTRAAMNVPVSKRIAQIRVNLERARWVFSQLPDDFVLVDIAGFKATLFRERAPVWEAAVQVGTPLRETPIFRDLLEYLVFNPSWTVPPVIFKNDILPELRKNPDYLRERRMRIIDTLGGEVESATIDWQRVGEHNFPYLIRQDPGPHNALGRIKFMFPNKHSVYLHDTPNKSGFRRQNRTFSSGCIRVDRPFELAELLLNDPTKWSSEKIAQVIDTGETLHIPLKRRLPVLLLYWTVAADESALFFRPDIYQRDVELLNALNGDLESVLPFLPPNAVSHDGSPWFLTAPPGGILPGDRPNLPPAPTITTLASDPTVTR
ncbi:MAG: L,D-transpeptidase family protein [Gammaproteobacteria bacterium]|nr:L,D-transpeptidase family protein [Gammaproteobacteria bacterium]